MEFVIVAGWLACGLLGHIVGAQKEAGTTGTVLGLLFGPLGVIVAGFIDARPICPTCGTRLNGQPTLCPACKTSFKWNGKTCEFFPPK
jgi:hypothetical protein